MSQDFWKFMLHEFLLENYLLQIRKINVFSTLGGFHNFEKSTISHKNLSFKKNQNIIPPKFLKILKLKKYHNPKIFENQCPTIFGNSWSMIF